MRFLGAVPIENHVQLEMIGLKRKFHETF